VLFRMQFPPASARFPYTTLFRSVIYGGTLRLSSRMGDTEIQLQRPKRADARRNYEKLVAAARAVFTEDGTSAPLEDVAERAGVRSEEHTSELQSRVDLVCRLLLE